MILREPALEGVTFSGGEPMLQAEPLARLASLVRVQGLSVVCYTGRVLEELRALHDPEIGRLLDNTDLLIDGPFDARLTPGSRWTGSANQRVIALSDRYRAAVAPAAAEIDFQIGCGSFTTSGIWPEGFLERLRAELEK